MKRLLGSLGLLVVLALSAFGAGCGGGSSSNTSSSASSSSGSSTSKSKTPANVDLTQGSNLKFAMVTHSDEGSFWSVVKKGAQQAADELAVSRWSIYRLIWDGRLQSIQVGRCRRIVRQSLDEVDLAFFG